MIKLFSHPFKVNILYNKSDEKKLVDSPTLNKFCILKAKFGR